MHSSQRQSVYTTLSYCTEVRLKIILGDPGAVSRVDKMSVVKVYCKMAVNKTRIGLLGSDRIGLRIGSDRITDRTSVFAFGAEELF